MEFIKSNMENKKLYLFKMSTCNPCKLMSNKLNTLNIEHEEFIIDEDGEEMADLYNIRTVPTLLVLEDDVEKRRLTGIINDETLKSL